MGIFHKHCEECGKQIPLFSGDFCSIDCSYRWHHCYDMFPPSNTEEDTKNNNILAELNRLKNKNDTKNKY